MGVPEGGVDAGSRGCAPWLVLFCRGGVFSSMHIHCVCVCLHMCVYVRVRVHMCACHLFFENIYTLTKRTTRSLMSIVSR